MNPQTLFECLNHNVRIAVMRLHDFNIYRVTSPTHGGKMLVEASYTYADAIATYNARLAYARVEAAEEEAACIS